MPRILIVDDNRDILEVIQVVLEIRGFTVKCIWNAAEIAGAIREFSPDLILLDVFLNDKNGIDICNELKSDPDTKDICIIMFSAQVSEENVLEQCPANGFIAKPFDIHQLHATIMSQLDKC